MAAVPILDATTLVVLNGELLLISFKMENIYRVRGSARPSLVVFYEKLVDIRFDDKCMQTQ